MGTGNPRSLPGRRCPVESELPVLEVRESVRNLAEGAEFRVEV